MEDLHLPEVESDCSNKKVFRLQDLSHILKEYVTQKPRKIFRSRKSRTEGEKKNAGKAMYSVRERYVVRHCVPMDSYRKGQRGIHRQHTIQFCPVAMSATKSAKTGTSSRTNWTPEMDEALRKAVAKYDGKNWKRIAEHVEGRNHIQCLQRWKKCIHPSLVKGHWSSEEDEKLRLVVTRYISGDRRNAWAEICKEIPGRTAKQCRERWSLNLDPNIKKGPWTPEEDMKILDLHSKMGNKWSEIAKDMEGRTENAIKGRYKSLIRAQQKHWTLEEDAIIIECKCAHKYRWNTISKKLKGRSKNSVRLRWRYILSFEPSLEKIDPETIVKTSKEFGKSTAERLFNIMKRVTPSKADIRTLSEPNVSLFQMSPRNHSEANAAKNEMKKVVHIEPSAWHEYARGPRGATVPKRRRHSLKMGPPIVTHRIEETDTPFNHIPSSMCGSSASNYDSKMLSNYTSPAGNRNIREYKSTSPTTKLKASKNKDTSQKSHALSQSQTSWQGKRKARQAHMKYESGYSSAYDPAFNIMQCGQAETSIDDALNVLSGLCYGPGDRHFLDQEVNSLRAFSPISEVLGNSRHYSRASTLSPTLIHPRQTGFTSDSADEVHSSWPISVSENMHPSYSSFSRTETESAKEGDELPEL